LGVELLRQHPFARQSQDALVHWESAQKIEGLALAVKQMVAWFDTCAFDPVLSEFRFRDQPDADGNSPDAPAWNIALDEGRTLKLQGSLDRLDVCVLPDGRGLIAVLDYKTGGQMVNEKRLRNGLELQLLGYLAFAVDSNELKAALARLLPQEASKTSTLLPAGAFYIPLSPRAKSQRRAATDADRRKVFLESLCHQGRADAQWLGRFDHSAVKDGRTWSCAQQFNPNQFKESDQFAELLKHTRRFLRQHAEAILGGCAGVQPVRFSASQTACDYCPFSPVCRFEPVFGSFRILKSAKSADAGGAGPAAPEPAGSRPRTRGNSPGPERKPNP
jgi:ATP-dependent helicase/nuclease subunit B